MPRAVKIKARNDYNLSAVGVGVLPALNIPQISGGAGTYFSTKWGPSTTAINSGPSIVVASPERKTIDTAKQLHHHIVPTQAHLNHESIKHTHKKKNFMSIFERSELHKKK